MNNQHANSSTGLTTAIRDFKYLLSSLLALSSPEPCQALKKRNYFKSLEVMKTHWNQNIWPIWRTKEVPKMTSTRSIPLETEWNVRSLPCLFSHSVSHSFCSIFAWICEIDTWISLRCYIDLKLLLHGFVAMIWSEESMFDRIPTLIGPRTFHSPWSTIGVILIKIIMSHLEE